MRLSKKSAPTLRYISILLMAPIFISFIAVIFTPGIQNYAMALAPVPAGPPTANMLNPASAVPGQTVDVIGSNLPSSVTLKFPGGQTLTINGTLDFQKIKLTFQLPNNLTAGQYTVSVAGKDLPLIISNGGPQFVSQPTQPVPNQGLPTNLGAFIQQLFTWSLVILGISVFVMFFYAGAQWFLTAGNTSKANEATKRMTNAVLGAVLLLASYLILNTINPDFISQTLSLPGLNNTSSVNNSGGGNGSGVGGGAISGGPIPTASLLSDLQSERAKYGAVLNHAEAGKLLNTVAFKNQSAGWGLLNKSGGNNCPLNGVGQPISCDWLVHKPSGLGLDVLNGAPGLDASGQPVDGPSTPQWGSGSLFNASDWVAPVP